MLNSSWHSMRLCTKNGEIDQAAWVRAYMDLTGVTESEARSVFMYLGCKDTVSTGDEYSLGERSC